VSSHLVSSLIGFLAHTILSCLNHDDKSSSQYINLFLIYFKFANENFHFLLHSPGFSCCIRVRLAAEALLAVKAAPHDTANVLADWNAGFGVSDGGPCNWSMVACSEAGHMDGSTGMPRWASARFLGYDIDLSHAGSDDLRALRRGAGDGVHDAPAARRAWAQLYCSRVGSTGPSRDNVMRHQGILGNSKILSPLFL
jgi:hypothetical protein